MFKEIRFSALLLMMCFGCDTAARQQAKEDARKAETTENLKEIGKQMHNTQSEQPVSQGNTQDAQSAPAANPETPPASSAAPGAETKPAP